MSVNKTVVIGTVLVGLSFSLQAASISNGNFDADTIGNFTFTAGQDWVLNNASNSGGLLNIDIDTDAITSGHSSPNVAWTTTGATYHSQTIGETVADNLQLELSFDVAPRADTAPATDFVGGLFTTGGTALATATAANVGGGLTAGTMKTVTVSFDAGVGHGQLGNAIEVRLGTATGGQITFDNVSVSVVPEPTTYALISGLGLVGLAAYRRTRARKA